MQAITNLKTNWRQEFIDLLQKNGYEYLNITHNDDLVRNLRTCLERLNNISFSNDEWQQILNKYLTNKNEGIKEKTIKVQEDQHL